MPRSDAYFAEARRQFHAGLLAQRILSLDSNGVPSNADKSQVASVEYAKRIAESLKVETVAERLAGQTSGGGFEQACADFLSATFPRLSMLRPGDWDIRKVSGRGAAAQASVFEQYAHLVELSEAVRANPQLPAVLGNGYSIASDVVISRAPVDDSLINTSELLVDNSVANHASIRAANQSRRILHAVALCRFKEYVCTTFNPPLASKCPWPADHRAQTMGSKRTECLGGCFVGNWIAPRVGRSLPLMLTR